MRLHQLNCGEALVPPAYFDRTQGGWRAMLTRRSTWTTLPLGAFALEHPTEGIVLVDTGFHPVDNLGTLHRTLFRERLAPEWSIPVQLRGLGLDPSDVRHVVMTHLHYDHTSGAAQFAGATFHVSRREWDAFHSGNPTLQGYMRHHLDDRWDWRLLDLDPAADADPFAHGLDLFDDGTLTLVSTPGHTKGHLSIVLDDDTLIVGDAAYSRETIERDWQPLICPDPPTFHRTLAHLRVWMEEHPGARVICTHDPQEWPRPGGLSPIPAVDT